MENNLILESDPYYCKHISNNDYRELQDFKVRVRKRYGYGLQIYIQEQALVDEDKRLSRTYIVRNKKTSEIVAYFSLRSGMISTNERRERARRTFDVFPGVELSNFAVNDSYLRNHTEEAGLGAIIFSDFIVPIADIAADYIGIKMLYIYALPEKELINRYRQYGFRRFDERQERKLHRRIRPYYDEGCIFMYIGL